MKRKVCYIRFQDNALVHLSGTPESGTATDEADPPNQYVSVIFDDKDDYVTIRHVKETKVEYVVPLTAVSYMVVRRPEPIDATAPVKKG